MNKIPCNKKSYRKKIDAKIALMNIQNSKKSQKKAHFEERIYYCAIHHGYHLTSLSKKNDKNLVNMYKDNLNKNQTASKNPKEVIPNDSQIALIRELLQINDRMSLTEIMKKTGLSKNIVRNHLQNIRKSP